MYQSSKILFVMLLLLVTIDSVNSLCKWYGYAPFCFIGNSCPSGCENVRSNNKGDGNTCWFGTQKNYCCCIKRAIDGVINSVLSK